MVDMDNLKKGILSNSIGLILLGLVGTAMHLEKLAGLSLAINWLVGLAHALPNNSEKFFDATGSVTYLTLISCATYFSTTHKLRQILDSLMVAVWCIRLGSFLLSRILRDGKDSRFDEMKKSSVRFLGVWTLQAVWCFLVSSPVLVVISSESCATSPTPYDFAGWSIWVCGFIFEVAADRQKDVFRADPANHKKFITTGLWAYSRHPNYFGEIMMWAGLCVSASSCLQQWEWLAWMSPLTTWLLLMKVSGVPALEAKGKNTWGGQPAYEWYMAKTPCIVPALRRPEAYNAEAYAKINDG